MGRQYDPDTHARSLDIHVIDRPITTADGLWIPDHSTIVLRSGLAPIRRKATLAHEVAHATLGHTTDSAENERAADELASRNLLGAACRLKTALWGTASAALAVELGVTAHLLQVWLEIAS